MTAQRTNLEMIASTVEEAIEKGLTELGLSQQDVEIEVLDEGTKGLFGLGSRQARVRLTVKSAPQPDSAAVSAPPEEPTPEEAPAQPQIQQELETPEPVSEPEQAPEEDHASETSQDAEEERILQIAQDTVAELLEKMKVRAEITSSYVEDDDYHGHKPILIDIHGDDLSILIGRKAETLNALQYITTLIVGKELGRSVPLTIDVEGYRTRRKKQLSQLARRVADQVVKTGRSQALEPMPASERRLVHIELRNDPDVYTESIGEGERRKVVIYLKD